MGIKVLSLFDGMSCGQLALNRLGIEVEDYYASEIDEKAIQVTTTNFPNTIEIGDVTKVSYKNGILYTANGEYNVGRIDLLLAGSPCQGFSLAGKQLAFDDPRSALYFEFERIKNEVKPKWWLLENVKMKQEHKDLISERLGTQPVAINSSLLSGQNRYRLYWSNLNITLPEDKKISLEQISEKVVDEKYLIKKGRLSWLENYGEEKESGGYVAFSPKKAKCLTVRSEASWNCTYLLLDENGVPDFTKSDWKEKVKVIKKGQVRKLTPTECEKLQTVPKNYTACVDDKHRYVMLGNGWTVDVICHILKQILEERNECEN